MKKAMVLLVVIVLGSASAAAQARDVRIAVPYLGVITNVYEDAEKNLDLEETGLLAGFFFQWVNPEKYQWNAFVYHSPDINYSSIWGGHFIFDYYFAEDRLGKYLVGAGIELIQIDMDAGNSIVPLQNFTLTNTVTVPYVRAGKYFNFRAGPAGISVLPWAGIQPEFYTGDLEFSAVFGPPPTPPTLVKESFDESDWYGIAGLNLKVNLFRFLDIEGKYQGTFNGDDYRSAWSALVNLFLNRSFGLSYRFKYMETSSGSDLYHLAGVAFVF
jgi:hypothetical protein